MSFKSLGLSDQVLGAVESAGYSVATPIQTQIIPIILKRHDVFGVAQTGTGKTASYCLPLLDLLNQSVSKARLPRALILAPTRELALQIRHAFDQYGKGFDLKTAICIGGESVFEQERVLTRGADVVIATPGRLLDTLGRGKIMLGGIDFLVIDEADRMLDMGFVPDIEKIRVYLSSKYQSLLFSATTSASVRTLTQKFLKNPLEICASAPAQTAQTVEQFQIHCPNKKKREVLRHLITKHSIQSAIIFCNRKRDIATLLNSLIRHQLTAAAIHGDLNQSERTETLKNFKQGQVRFLVASDVASRGIDVDDMNFVINFEPPTSPEEYVHRIGRTGRAGRKGMAFTLVGENDGKYMTQVEKLIDKKIDPVDLLSEMSALDVKKDQTTVKRTRTTAQTKNRTKSPELDHSQPLVAPGTSMADIPHNHAGTSPISQSTTYSRRGRAQLDAKPIIGFGQEIPAFFQISWPSVLSENCEVAVS